MKVQLSTSEKISLFLSVFGAALLLAGVSSSHWADVTLSQNLFSYESLHSGHVGLWQLCYSAETGEECETVFTLIKEDAFLVVVMFSILAVVTGILATNIASILPGNTFYLIGILDTVAGASAIISVLTFSIVYQDKVPGYYSRFTVRSLVLGWSVIVFGIGGGLVTLAALKAFRDASLSSRNTLFSNPVTVS